MTAQDGGGEVNNDDENPESQSDRLHQIKHDRGVFPVNQEEEKTVNPI